MTTNELMTLNEALHAIGDAARHAKRRGDAAALGNHSISGEEADAIQHALALVRSMPA